MKKIILFTTCFFIFSLSLAATAVNPHKPLIIMLDWFANPDHAPLFVAQEFGFFKQAGLTVKLIGPANPDDPPKLVAVGKADLAIAYQPSLYIQVKQGLPLIRIATLVATPLNCLVVLKASHINSIKDLKGKTIGYSSAATDHVALKMMLQRAGLKLSDVKLINVHFNLSQALLSKRIDAAMGMMRNFELIEMKLHHVAIKAFFPEEYGMPLYNELIIVANKNKLTDPRLPKFLQALTEATLYFVNHPQQTWLRFAKLHPALNNSLNRQAWFANLSRFALRPAALDKTRFAAYAKFLVRMKVIEHALPVKQYAVALKY